MELNIKGLTKDFKDFRAVDHVSCSMGQGVYGLLGVNGAGEDDIDADDLYPVTSHRRLSHMEWKGYFQDGRVISESTRVSAPGLRVLSGFYGTGLYDVYFIHQRNPSDDGEEADRETSGTGGTPEDEKEKDEESFRRNAAQSWDCPGYAERSADPDP